MIFRSIDPLKIRLTERLQGAFWNARQSLVNEDLVSLRESIRDVGLNVPPVVRELADGTYELIAGERRIRSLRWLIENKVPCFDKASQGRTPAQKLYKTVQCRVEVDCDDKRASQLSVSENLERENVSDVDLMQYCLDLVSLKSEHGEPLYTRKEIEEIIHRSATWISQTLSLHELSDRAKELLGNGTLPRTTALYLLKLEPEAVDKVLDRAEEIAAQVKAAELQQIENEINQAEENLQAAEMTIALADRFHDNDKKKQATNAKAILNRTLDEAQSRQETVRVRKPRLTQDTLQAAADEIPGARRGKSSGLSHKLIRAELTKLSKFIEEPTGDTPFLLRDVRLVRACMEMFIGLTAERTPLDLLDTFYKSEGEDPSLQIVSAA